MTESEPSLPTDLEILHSRIHDEWEAFSAVLSVLSEPQIIRRDPGEWSVKDILAHIATWEKFLILNQFLGMPAAEALCIDPAVIDRADENEVNAILFERNRNRALVEVQSDWYETHRWLMSELVKIGEDALAASTLCFGPDPKPLAQWVVLNTYDHYADHRRTIEARKTI
ncbi:MAG TPA: DinB family protein [Anaerolineales bacterium]